MSLWMLAPLALAVGTGLALERRQPTYRPMARALAALLALDLARAATTAALHSSAPPRVGFQRAVWGLDGALWCAWYAIEAWAVWRALRGRQEEAPGSLPPRASLDRLLSRPAAVVALSALAVTFVAAYPVLHGAPMQAVEQGVEWASLAVQLAVGIPFAAARGLRREAWEATTPMQRAGATLALAACSDLVRELCVRGSLLDRFWLQAPVNVVYWSLLCLFQLHALNALRKARR